MKNNLVIDVDGVMTTGQFLYSADGKSHKIFGPHDADGLKLVKDYFNIFFITADKRGYPISEKRINDIGFSVELVDEKDRYSYIKEKFGFENTIFIGDGIYDVPIIQNCLFGVVPANARVEAKRFAKFITPSASGEGAVCDACLEIKKRFIDSETMSYKVFIPSAGIGSRLGEFTKDKNKSLVKVAGRETLRYIVEKFPENIEIVIALGYKGEQIKSFLESNYVHRKFTFVEIDNFDGPGSGLGYTMLQCKNYLQCPFIFISNDTIVLEEIPEPDTNFLGYSTERDTTQFRSLKLNGDKILELYEKGFMGDVLPYIGVAGIKDFEEFWRVLENNKEEFMRIGESAGIRHMLRKNIVFRGIFFNWFDIGNLHDLNRTETILKEIRIWTVKNNER